MNYYTCFIFLQIANYYRYLWIFTERQFSVFDNSFQETEQRSIEPRSGIIGLYLTIGLVTRR